MKNVLIQRMDLGQIYFKTRKIKKFILAIAGSDLRPLKFDIGDLIGDFILLNGKIPKKQFNSLLKFYMLIKKEFCFL